MIEEKSRRQFLVVLSPVVKLPIEIEKLLIVVEYPRPSRDQLRTIAAELATEEGEMPEGLLLDQLLDAAAAGL